MLEVREARGTRGARHERREATVLWVDAQQGSCNFFFLFSFMGLCKCLWEAPVGTIV